MGTDSNQGMKKEIKARLKKEAFKAVA